MVKSFPISAVLFGETASDDGFHVIPCVSLVRVGHSFPSHLDVLQVLPTTRDSVGVTTDDLDILAEYPQF